ncbi:MAG: hypothetical protein CFK52_13700 [Chloracidobacterium sp. CP2_5A]|nr:MAG: hypothetical protein CFK52_13700 [Chloracidobacterium sp. CP2_5A]
MLEEVPKMKRAPTRPENMKPSPLKGRSIYPFDRINPGESFLVPYGDGNPQKVRQRISMAAWTFRQTYPEKRFIVKAEPDGVRVWRYA